MPRITYYMNKKSLVFVGIAVLFVFTYPFRFNFIANGWTVSYGRPWYGYLLPVYYLLMALLYYYRIRIHRPASDGFFWGHVMLTILPAIFINEPMIQFFFNSARFDRYEIVRNFKRLELVGWVFWCGQLYFTVNLLFEIVFKLKQSIAPKRKG